MDIKKILVRESFFMIIYIFLIFFLLLYIFPVFTFIPKGCEISPDPTLLVDGAQIPPIPIVFIGVANNSSKYNFNDFIIDLMIYNYVVV